MPKKSEVIPVNIMADHFDVGVVIERMYFSFSEETTLNLDEAKQSHREDRHSFFLLESGTVIVEIDFSVQPNLS